MAVYIIIWVHANAIPICTAVAPNQPIESKKHLITKANTFLPIYGKSISFRRHNILFSRRATAWPILQNEMNLRNPFNSLPHGRHEGPPELECHADRRAPPQQLQRQPAHFVRAVLHQGEGWRLLTQPRQAGSCY